MIWAGIQQTYYNLMSFQHTGEHLIIPLIYKVWSVAQDIGEHHIGILGEQLSLAIMQTN
jgi:hypothetical protein